MWIGGSFKIARTAEAALFGSGFAGLGKLRFKVANVQHRPLGFFGPERKMFTLLIWSTERDGKFNPPNVRDTALDRMNQVLRDRERANECNF